MTEKKNKYIVFDMDGLMFDTECVFVLAWDYAGEKWELEKPDIWLKRRWV